MPSRNAQIVEAMYAALASRDLATIATLLDPSVEIYQSEQLPWGGHYKGVLGVQQFLAKLTAAVEAAVEITAIIDSGERIIALGSTRGTVRATKQAFDLPVAHLWHVRGGKVVRVDFHADHPALLAALRR
jgi:ketosteroid isomerase-like protein